MCQPFKGVQNCAAFFGKLSKYVEVKELKPIKFYQNGDIVCMFGTVGEINRETQRETYFHLVTVWQFNNHGKPYKLREYLDTAGILSTFSSPTGKFDMTKQLDDKEFPARDVPDNLFVQATKDLFAALSRGDIPAILKQVDEEVTWCIGEPHIPLPWFGAHRTHAGIAAGFNRIYEHVDVLSFVPDLYFVNGNSVLAIGYAAVKDKLTGVVAKHTFCMTFDFNDAFKVVAHREIWDTAASIVAHYGEGYLSTMHIPLQRMRNVETHLEAANRHDLDALMATFSAKAPVHVYLNSLQAHNTEEIRKLYADFGSGNSGALYAWFNDLTLSVIRRTISLDSIALEVEMTAYVFLFDNSHHKITGVQIYFDQEEIHRQLLYH